ncbi:MAG TPA: class I SAM-dependent methyltransferase [Miltoncostaeaceae bacterium]|jgi:SAM-dependent methyltransferase|nr:class I SAM-dependent methyltransferase [Miltoncostaeaceae bacterium]
MATTAPRQHATPWPLAQRLAAGLAQPGGPAMTRRALEGAGLEAGDRVVELAPGAGLTTALILERDPREWVGVEPDALAADHLERSVRGQGREIARAPVDATGLADASASVVMADALLCTLDDADAQAVLAEAGRLLRPGGRVALHELAPAEGPADPEAAADLASAGIRPRSAGALRALAEDARFVVVGSLTGRLALLAPHELMRGAGPRTALRVTREMARDGRLRGAATSARGALERRALSLRSAVVVAEIPLILGMRRPRR